MPSLNVSSYIEECLISVINQTINEIEILCIDGGSTDGTTEIIKKYAKTDDRVVFITSDKRSHGYQCNIGMEMARGKYIGFVETDDYIEPDMFQTLYEVAEKNNLDCVKSDFYGFVDLNEGIRYQEKKKIFPQKNEWYRYGISFSPAEHTDVLRRDNNMWNGIYRRTFIEKYNIRLNETDGAAYQDMGFLFQTICQANRMTYIDRGFYHYRRDNENSSVYSLNGLEKIWKEFGFCKSFLVNNDEAFRSWWIEFYFKLSGMSIANRIAIIMQNSNGLTKETRNILVGVRNEIEEGMKLGIIQLDSFSLDRLMEIDLLLKNVDAYSEYLGSLRRVKIKYHNLMIRKAQEKQLAVIFGCTKEGQRLCVLLYKSGKVTNILFCDNNISIQGTELLGFEIVSPAIAVSSGYSSVYYITGKGSAIDMFKQLINLGVSREDIVFYQSTGIEI